MLYEVVILQNPTEKQVKDEGMCEKLIYGPKAVCAASESAAAVIIAREAPVEGIDPNRLEVIVRPFGNKR